MKKITLLIAVIGLVFSIQSCKPEDEPTLGTAPTAADAAFTFAESSTSPNIIDFTASNSTMTAKWDFGNGTLGEGTTAQGTFPNAGTYTVTLTVFNSGGSASTSQDVVIDNDDPTLLDNQLYEWLTGGTSGPGSKTWVVDSTRDGHMGVGPTTSYWAEWWAATRLGKTETGLYNDRYVFTLSGFKFDHITNGSVYVNSGHEGDFASSYENKDDFTAAHPDQLDETWVITEGEDTTITVSGSSHIGFYSGVRTYQIINIEENQILLRYEDTKEDLVWYIRLVPEDYPIDNGGSGGGGGDPKFTLPLDFESVEPTFTTFGNSTYAIIDNPDASGINTSAKVLETVHGNETWAGLFVDLENALDFSTNGNLAVKVYAPAAGTMRMKIESSADPNTFIEQDVMVPSANTWVEVMVDMSAAAAATYDRVVLFPGWDVADAGTFYLDDISQK